VRLIGMYAVWFVVLGVLAPAVTWAGAYCCGIARSLPVCELTPGVFLNAAAALGSRLLADLCLLVQLAPVLLQAQRLWHI
jgi:hypothetical protein